MKAFNVRAEPCWESAESTDTAEVNTVERVGVPK